MRRLRVVLTLTVASIAGIASAQATPCDPASLRDAADTARFNIIAARDGAEALGAWRTVLDAGGAVGWAVTEYNVDARSTFVLVFDRSVLRVYRADAFGPTTDVAMDGCIDHSIPPEAVIPWQNVREIEAGNWVLWFKLREPVVIRSDRGKRKKVDELKAYFHGGPSGNLTYLYNRDYEGHIPFWNIDVFEISNLRGIAVGPNDYQRRLQFVIARVVDPERRITLKRKGPGAGW
jgi:hypothetical protein